MILFRIRICSVLVSTDVAAMGLDVEDLNLCLSIGKNLGCLKEYWQFVWRNDK